MKDGFRQIVGKTIASVLIGKNERDPKIQVFLVFSDNTALELYGSEFNCAGGLDKGGAPAAAEYIRHMGGVITKAYPKSARCYVDTEAK